MASSHEFDHNAAEGRGDSAATPVHGEAHLQSLRQFAVNWCFVKRGCRLLAVGLRTPQTAPWLWLLILLDITFQLVGAYIIQAQLYVVATGKDNNYPGIAGCLKGGCGSVATAPGEKAVLENYLLDFAWLFALSMVLMILMSFGGDVINTMMRKNAAETMQARLLKDNKLLYRLTVDGTIDNIDQRITSDLQVVLDGFTCVLFGNSADYLAYPVIFIAGRIAFALSACFSLPETQDSTKQGQIMGVVLAAVFIAIATYILPINHVSRIFYCGQRFEGDFRATHTRAVLNAQQISMLHGEAAEQNLAEFQYERIDSNNRLYYFWQGVLLILRLFVTIAIPACSYICLAVTQTVNTTTANFFQKQVGDVLEYFLYVPVLVERLAFACGATHRVGQLLEQMDKFETCPVITRVEFAEDVIELRGVVANPPVSMPHDKNVGKDGMSAFGEGAKDDLHQSLFEGVNLKVKKGESLCIVGPSGCGKSSLLRVIAGLWGVDAGCVVKPRSVGRAGVFFLPQRPYVFVGTLQMQIEYPGDASTSEVGKNRAMEVLRLVFLQHLVERYGMDSEVNWKAALSISEMQRLNFARMFYHQPAFCLADECTSSMDLRLESFLYGKCFERGISMISIAHRPTVIPHHEYVFRYEPSTHCWSQLPSSEVQTCGKFSTEGLVQAPPQWEKEEDKAPEKEEGFNFKFLKRLRNALVLAIPEVKSQGVAFLITMIICMIIYGIMTIVVFSSYGTSKIITQVVQANLTGALKDAFTILGLNAICALVQSLSCYLGAILAVKVQGAIVASFHSDYFSSGVVYHVNDIMRERGIDQRIVQDLAGFRESLAWLFGNPFAYCNYRVGVLPLSITWFILLGYAFSTCWQLTLFLLVFMLLSYASQNFASAFTSVAVERRQRCEGDLRLHMGLVLHNIETITFFGGEAREQTVSDKLLQQVCASRMRYNCLANATSIPTVTMYYWLQTGIYVMAAILQLYWAPGSIAPSALFTTINFDIIWAKVTQLMIMCMGGFGMVAGFTHRVMHVLEQVEKARSQVDHVQRRLMLSSDSIVFDNVSVNVPSQDPGRLLVRDLSMRVPGSVSVFGHGKSSIARVLAGMWPTAGGTIWRPPCGRDGIVFIPQANYTVQGTLAAQVVYPDLLSGKIALDEQLTSILEEVGLGALVRRWGLHKTVNWDVVLSGGECQRLGFARVLYHLPKFAVLDETTSALDMATERRCMKAVARRNISFISFATRPSVAKYHHQQLNVSAGGDCTLFVGPKPSRSKVAGTCKGSVQMLGPSCGVLWPSQILQILRGKAVSSWAPDVKPSN